MLVRAPLCLRAPPALHCSLLTRGLPPQTDRGFGTSHTTEVTYVPVSVDMATGIIKTRKELKHRFMVRGWI